MPKIVSVPKETVPGEQRVALVPELVPRLTKAGLDVVGESAAGGSGYRAFLIAAPGLTNFSLFLMPAAGTITPARVFVLGAGVAGLQAIGTAKRLGAVVEASDTRPVVKEQVESLGAKFAELGLA